MFYIGVLSGLLATIMPFDAYNYKPWEFEAIRFFVAHAILMTAPMLMVLCGHHRLDWRRTWKAPLVLACVMFVIFINDIMLVATGIVPDATVEEVIHGQVRNGAMVYGPAEELESFKHIFLVFTPDIFLTVPFGPDKGAPFYWPVLWVLVPGFIYITTICFFISLIFDFRRFKNDMRTIFSKQPKKASRLKG